MADLKCLVAVTGSSLDAARFNAFGGPWDMHRLDPNHTTYGQK